MIAVIAGSGLEKAFGFSKGKRVIKTKYGPATLFFWEETVFLPRHGPTHSVPPHRINHRANIMALQGLGVKQIVSSSAVGSLSRKIRPGALVIPDDFIDLSGLNLTFFDDKIGHTQMSEPFSPELRKVLVKSAKEAGQKPVDGGTYVCGRGPRYETPAEASAFRKLGGDVIGMTAVPEAILARELGMSYATLALATNFSGEKSRHEEVVSAVKKIPLPQILRLAVSTLS